MTDRRRFLSAAGVSLALPLMESIMSSRAEGPVVKRMVCLSNNYGIYPAAFFPQQGGTDYAMPETLGPLERHRDHFTVFSHLDHGISGGHACVPTFLNGVRPYLAAHFPEGNISMDQKATEHVGAQTRFPSMSLKVNDANLISITRTGVQVPAVGIRDAYRALFVNQPASDRAALSRRFQRHRSILDVLLEEAGDVKRALGEQDQRKFAEYLDSVRSLEKKLVQQEPWIDRPKPETEREEPRQGQGTEADLRSAMELIALAIETDSTRVVTLTSGFRGGDFGLSGGYHGFSHHGEREKEVAAVKAIEKNQIAQMAHLMDLLHSREDPINGGTLLDHTMVLFGCGMATGHHSTKDLPLLLAGGGFQHGEHKVYPDQKGKRVPAANLLLSMLQGFGMKLDRFGTSTGSLTGLVFKG